MIRIQVTRANTLNTRASDVRKRIGALVEAGMYKAAEVLLERSKALVPRDTEDLVNSGRIQESGFGIDSVVTVGYGGQDIGPQTSYSSKKDDDVAHDVWFYAQSQHQDMSLHHDTGQAHYLSQPAEDTAVQQSMKMALRTAVKSI